MRLSPAGTSDVQLSAIGLGGAWLGHDMDDASEITRAASVLHAVDECGVNWVDTSENYFDTGNEAVIGRAMASMPEFFLICSKVAPGASHSGGGSGFRPAQVRQACEDSLRRLQRERLDLYLLHWPDDTGVPLLDTWEAMAGLVNEGKVRCIGLSNYEQTEIADCHRQRPVDVIQTGLNIVQYLEDRELIAWCGQQGIAVTVYDPLAGGILTDATFEQVRQRWIGTPWEDMTVARGLLAPDNEERVTSLVDGLRLIAGRLDITVAQLSLAWLLRQPGVTSAIPGSRRPDRARSNSFAGEVVLPDDVVRFIDDDLIPRGPAFG